MAAEYKKSIRFVIILKSIEGNLFYCWEDIESFLNWKNDLNVNGRDDELYVSPIDSVITDDGGKEEK